MPNTIPDLVSFVIAAVTPSQDEYWNEIPHTPAMHGNGDIDGRGSADQALTWDLAAPVLSPFFIPCGF